MKKVIMAAVLTIIVILAFIGIGCLSSANAWGNRTWWDTTYSFERAVIGLPNGESIEGDVEQWLDFEESDMIQVKIDGKVYLTHSVNVVLISE